MTLPTPIAGASAAATSTAAPFVLGNHRLIRPDDQLWIDVSAINLHAVPGLFGEWEVRVREPSEPAFLTFTLTPQHTMEFSGGAPSRHVVSASSRIAVRVLPALEGFAFSLAGLLFAMKHLPLAVDAVAGLASDTFKPPSDADFQSAETLLADSSPEAAVLDLALQGLAQTSDAAAMLPHADTVFGPSAQALIARTGGVAALAPVPGVVAAAPPSVAGTSRAAEAAASAFTPTTSLAISSRMEFTPRGGATRFDHATLPVLKDGRAELWHTRLSMGIAGSAIGLEGSNDLVGLRAPASASSGPTGWATDVLSPSLAAVLPSEAANIVALARDKQSSLDPALALRTPYLHLSGIGASMDLSGEWPLSTTVKSWRHRTALGRDQVQRLVKLGKLYPFGHDAVLTNTTERRFLPNTGGNGNRSVLGSSSIITVREPYKPYDGDASSAGRQFPFGSIELLTVQTPAGTLQTVFGSAQVLATGSGFSARAFAFRCVGTDRAGRPLRFELPLVFVPNDFTAYTDLAVAWKARADLSQLSLHGQTLTTATPAAPAASASASAGSEGPPRPADATDVIAALAKLNVVGGSAFKPVVEELSGRLPSVERFASSAGPLTVRYFGDYLTQGFAGTNTGEVVLQLVGATPVLGLAQQAASGGLMSGFSMGVTGLSRLAGPVAGALSLVAQNQFDVNQWLGSAFKNMTLLGVVPLSSLMQEVTNTLADAPRLDQNTIDGLRKQTMRWTVPLFKKEPTINLGPARLSALPGASSQAVVEAVVSVQLDGSMTTRTSCTVSNLQLGLGIGAVDLVTVPFASIRFTSIDGHKPECDVVMGRIGFHDVLAFVGVLASLIDSLGFSDPPAIELTADGVRSSFSAPVPNIAVGVFSLENISFGARFDLFFSGRSPEIALNFASFDNPFRLTVSMLGGGGYIGVSLSATQGLTRLEGALEFGAALSVNLVVAKGSVSAMGGVYFLVEDNAARITGYMRVKGQLDVLGLISVAMEMLMAMSYDNGVVRGKAEISVKVKLLFFSKTVRITFERSFAGSNADPTFAELMAPEGAAGPTPWDEYCMAHA
jgi:hypothetical protein